MQAALRDVMLKQRSHHKRQSRDRNAGEDRDPDYLPPEPEPRSEKRAGKAVKKMEKREPKLKARRTFYLVQWKNHNFDWETKQKLGIEDAPPTVAKKAVRKLAKLGEKDTKSKVLYFVLVEKKDDKRYGVFPYSGYMERNVRKSGKTATEARIVALHLENADKNQVYGRELVPRSELYQYLIQMGVSLADTLQGSSKTRRVPARRRD